MRTTDVTPRPGEPKNADELLWQCRLLITRGDPEAAARLAQHYVAQAEGGRHIDQAERFRRLAYAWYVLCQAGYQVCLGKPDAEVHAALVYFFTAYKKSSWYFLKFLQSFDYGLRVSARDTRLRDEIDILYDSVYRTWGAGVAGRADLAANKEVSL